MTWGHALLDRLDDWQQRRPGPSFAVAVFVRYREDRGRFGHRPTDADRRAIEEVMQREALLPDARVRVLLGAVTDAPERADRPSGTLAP